MSESNRDWLAAHPEIKSLRLAIPDLNGVARGKRIPAAHAEKAFAGGARMPLSALNVDIWGCDIVDSPLVFQSGDQDGVLQPTSRGLVPMRWFDAPAALLPLWMLTDQGGHFAGDPRHALSGVLARYRDRGLTPVAATELEGYLLDGTSYTPRAPLSPNTGQRISSAEVLALSGSVVFDPLLCYLSSPCSELGIPADAAISESGTAQFEINLLHRDALDAADDAWLFTIAARGTARKHGLAACFMAKPFFDQPGNGLHTHFSVLNEKGDNVFDDGSDKGSAVLQQAVGGLLAGMRASTLVFAPHFNSYRRMTPNNHAPTSVNWGYENRTTAVRIPGGNNKARRIEHRVAGGDVNPYLMLAVVLGAALTGIEDELTPTDPISGNAYAKDAPALPDNWQDAIDLFRNDPLIARIFPRQLIDNYTMQKAQELAAFQERSDEFEFHSYMETV